MIKLSGLSTCLLYSVNVVCRQSVTRNPNNSMWLCLQQRVQQRFFSQTHVSGGVIKNILVSIIIINVTFIVDA